MFEALLIFVGGLTAAGHCLGMCGGFVLTLGAAAPSVAANLVRQLVYACGRVSVYVLAGAIVGYTGWRLGMQTTLLVNTQAILAILAGLLLLVQGLVSAGAISWFRQSSGGCPGASVFAALLRAPHLGSVFVAGACNALLPCAMVYAFLALAASTADMLHGAVVMALFGFGTVPALVLAGLGGGILSVKRRMHLLRLAGWCVVLTGALTLVRGVTFLSAPASDGTTCPLCP